LGVAALVIALAMAGVVLWGAAVIGVGQYAEDICLDDFDGRPAYGAYRTAEDAWPPSYECRLLGKGVEPVVVQHRGVALARRGAVVVFPIAYAVAAMLGIVFWRRRAVLLNEHQRQREGLS
jgi:uncharacterized iron-regulated membrane protein